MMKIIHYLGLSFCFLAQLCFAQQSPVPMLESSANQVVEKLSQHHAKANTKQLSQLIREAVYEHILPHVDVDGMSRTVLGASTWKKATPEERAAFTKAFTRLVINTYATPLKEYHNETVKFLPVRGSLDKRFIKVNSIVIRPQAKNIPVTYSLVSKQGEWKIYDLSVEGVSLLQSFRSQFSDALKNETMQNIIAKLNKQSNGLPV